MVMVAQRAVVQTGGHPIQLARISASMACAARPRWLAVFLVWRNYMKGRKEKVRGSPTPAQARGMRVDRLEIAELLESRLFASRITLPGRWLEYYGRRVRTRVLERQTVHNLKYAY